VKTGDLIQFKMIAAGRTDNPQYSEDGSWRIGILLGYGYHTIIKEEYMARILYRNQIFHCRIEQMRSLCK